MYTLIKLRTHAAIVLPSFGWEVSRVVVPLTVITHVIRKVVLRLSVALWGQLPATTNHRSHCAADATAAAAATTLLSLMMTTIMKTTVM